MFGFCGKRPLCPRIGWRPGIGAEQGNGGAVDNIGTHSRVSLPAGIRQALLIPNITGMPNGRNTQEAPLGFGAKRGFILVKIGQNYTVIGTSISKISASLVRAVRFISGVLHKPNPSRVCRVCPFKVKLPLITKAYTPFAADFTL